jgi:hypothetical protein
MAAIWERLGAEIGRASTGLPAVPAIRVAPGDVLHPLVPVRAQRGVRGHGDPGQVEAAHRLGQTVALLRRIGYEGVAPEGRRRHCLILSGGASHRNVRRSKDWSARLDVRSKLTAAEAPRDRERYQGNGAACATAIRFLGEGFKDPPWL